MATLFTSSVAIAFVDEAGDITARRIEVKPAEISACEDPAAIATLVEQIVTDLQAASDCGVQYFHLLLEYTPASPTTPQAGSECENTAQLALPLVQTSPDQLNKYGILNIPSPKIGMFVGSSGPNKNVVDMADALVTALVSHFQAAGDFTMSDGQSVSTDVGSGRRVHKRSKKGRGRRVG